MRTWERRALRVDGHTVMTFSLGDGHRTLMLVHGEHDYIVPELANMARDRLPHGQLAFFPGCSHMPFYEDPAGYVRAVSHFLNH